MGKRAADWSADDERKWKHRCKMLKWSNSAEDIASAAMVNSLHIEPVGHYPGWRSRPLSSKKKCSLSLQALNLRGLDDFKVERINIDTAWDELPSSTKRWFAIADNCNPEQC
jgi:hypothetical protein